MFGRSIWGLETNKHIAVVDVMCGGVVGGVLLCVFFFFSLSLSGVKYNGDTETTSNTFELWTE